MTLVIGFAFLFVGFTCWWSGWAIGRAMLARSVGRVLRLKIEDYEGDGAWKE